MLVSDNGTERRRLFDNPPPSNAPPSPASSPRGLGHGHHSNYIDIADEDNIHVDINDPREATYTHSLTEDEKQDKIRESIRTGAMLLLALFILMWGLIYFDTIIIPLVFSRFMVYLVQPFINLLIGKKPLPVVKKRLFLPRWFAVTIAFLLLVILLVLLGLIISSSVRDVINDKDRYIAKYEEIMQWIVDFGATYGYNPDEVRDMLPEIDFAGLVMDLVVGLLEIIPASFLILLFTLYMLLDYDEKQIKSRLRAQVDKQIRTYIIIKVALSAVGGIIAGITYAIFRVPFGMLFALLTFILNFIPNIGSIISYMLPIPILILDDSIAWWAKITAIAIPLLSDMVMGNVVEPKVLGKSMDIPPITVLISLMFWGQIWGIMGAILSVPLTVTIITYLKSIDHPMPRFMADILVGDFSFLDPEPTPVVSASSSIRKKKKKTKKGAELLEA